MGMGALGVGVEVGVEEDVEEVPVDADEEAVAAEEVMEADMAHLVNTTDQSLNYKIQ